MYDTTPKHSKLPIIVHFVEKNIIVKNACILQTSYKRDIISRNIILKPIHVIPIFMIIIIPIFALYYVSHIFLRSILIAFHEINIAI